MHRQVGWQFWTAAVLAVLTGYVSPSPSQANDEANRQWSVGYEYRGGINERLRIFGDLVYKELEYPGLLFEDQNQVSTTGGVSFDLGQRSRLEAGLGFYNIHRAQLLDTFGTHFWQAVTFDWPEVRGHSRRYVLHHRFRLDERFSKTGDWSFGLRSRYRLTFAFPINGYTVQPGVFYIPLKAELFVPLGDDVELLFAERVIYSAGLGYVFNSSWTLDLKYAWQHLRDTIDSDLRLTDHFIELRFKSSFRVDDLLKGR